MSTEQEPAAAPAPAAPSTPAAVPAQASWLESLPAELRGDPSLKDFKDVAALATSYKHAQKFTGNQDPNRVVLWPTDPNDEKGMADIYKRLGRPDTVDGYKLDDFKPPEGLPWDAEFQKDMVAVLHSAGASEAQVKKVLAGYAEKTSAMFEQAGKAQKQMAIDSQATLQKEWGLKFDENFAISEAMLNKHADDEFIKDIMAVGLHNKASTLRFLANIGQGMKEADLHFAPGSSGLTGAMTPEQAISAINAKRADPVFQKQHGDRDDPGHAHAVKELEDLYKQAYPQAKKA